MQGTEVEVGVLGNLEPIASLPGEIVVTHNEWYDYEAKYDEGEMDLIVPARVTEAQLARAQDIAVHAFKAADCEGMARAEEVDRLRGIEAFLRRNDDADEIAEPVGLEEGHDASDRA